MSKNFDITIVGGGIVGASTAYQLTLKYPDLKIALIEKEAQAAKHQTGHNSGVIHAGVYYEPGSLKAKFCVEGNAAAKAFCDEQGIDYKVPGKLITAVNEQELIWLEDLKKRCIKNGLTVEPLDKEQMIDAQPGLASVGGFLVKETGVIHWPTVCQRFLDLFKQAGGEIFYGEQLESIDEQQEEVILKTKTLTIHSSYMIACAGLYADKVLAMAGIEPDFKIIPFRGEYYRLTDKYDDYFKHCIYPVPNPKLPFLGVHFTPQIAGFTTIGPNAVLALAREGYTWGTINVKETLSTLFFPAFWRLLLKNFSATCSEFTHSISKSLYLKRVNAYFPEIKKAELSTYPAGVRAQALGKDGTLIDDFLFKNSQRTLHTCNAPSPAATSSIPIGKYIVSEFEKRLAG